MPPTYIAGLDLGPANEPTALAIVERSDGTPRTYALRHLTRYPVGTPYQTIMADVASRLGQLEGQRRLAVDVTAVGQPVLRLLYGSGIMVQVQSITLTAGQELGQGNTCLHVPRKDVVTTLQVLFQTMRLKIASGLPDAGLLVQELTTFRAKPLSLAPEAITWREAPHDDLVLAVGLTVWLGENIPEPYLGPLVYWPLVGEAAAQRDESPLAEILARMDEEERLYDPWGW